MESGPFFFDGFSVGTAHSDEVDFIVDLFEDFLDSVERLRRRKVYDGGVDHVRPLGCLFKQAVVFNVLPVGIQCVHGEFFGGLQPGIEFIESVDFSVVVVFDEMADFIETLESVDSAGQNQDEFDFKVGWQFV